MSSRSDRPRTARTTRTGQTALQQSDAGNICTGSRALALLICGATLSACSSLPGVMGSQPSLPTVALDSTPPGAEASFSGGGSCKTPCSLRTPGNNGTYYVNFVLDGHVRQSIPVRVSTGKENWYSSETTTIEPSTVTARLEALAPSAPPKKKKKRPTTQAAQKPATATTAASSPRLADPPAPALPPWPSTPPSSAPAR